MYGSPTVVDLDRDGFREIIVGTSMGFIYVLDHLGNTMPGWPVQMGDVQAQVRRVHAVFLGCPSSVAWGLRGLGTPCVLTARSFACARALAPSCSLARWNARS